MIRNNQSLIDVALQEYGSVEGLVDLALRNGKSVTDYLQISKTLQIGTPVNKDIVSYIKARNISISTGADMYYPPIINITPTPLIFGIVEVGSSAVESFEIENTGTTDLIVASISIPNAVYTLDWDSGTIAPLGSQTVNITFTPTASANYDGSFTVTSNAETGVNVLNVTASGLTAKAGRFDKINDWAQGGTISGFTQDSNKTIYIELDADAEDGTFNDYFYYGNESLTSRKFFIVKTNTANQLRFGNVVGGTFNETNVTLPEITSKCKLVATQSSTQLKVYANGTLKTTATWSPLGASVTTDSFYIGRLPTAPSLYKGLIKRVKIFNRVLDATEVANIDTVTSGLIHSWDFNDMSGASLPDRVGSNNITLLGGVTQVDW